MNKSTKSNPYADRVLFGDKFLPDVHVGDTVRIHGGFGEVTAVNYTDAGNGPHFIYVNEAGERLTYLLKWQVGDLKRLWELDGETLAD